MKQLLWIFMMILGAMQAVGQDQLPLKKAHKRKIDKEWTLNRTLKSIRNNRDTCEVWIKRLKDTQLETADHKARYLEVKRAYDVLLNGIIKEIAAINSMGDWYQFMISAEDRKNAYRRECMYADRLCIEFINASFITVHGDLFAQQEEVMNAWLDLVMPGLVRNMSALFLESLKNYYIRKLEGLRFYPWEKVM
jgi:hypothetical protein